MPDVTNRELTRSPSPPAKRARLESPSMISTSNEHHTNIVSPAAGSPIVPTDAPTESLKTLVEREMQGPIEVPRTYTKEIDYENKLVLAPMVRTGSSEYRTRL
jgi:hypothetical protein